MKYFALMYDVVDGFAEKRLPFRPAHLAHVRAAHERGEIVMAGALGDPIEHALIVFRGESPEAAEQFAKTDPYVINGAATTWKVRPWHVVVGGDAA